VVNANSSNIRRESHPFPFVRDLCKIRSGNGLWKRVALIVSPLIALGGVVGFRCPGRGLAMRCGGKPGVPGPR
jgi:hypothetical protein